MFRELEVTSTELKLTPQMDKIGTITFQLSTEDVETETEVPAYTISSLLSDIGGNVGIFTGLSLLSVLSPKQFKATSGSTKARY